MTIENEIKLSKTEIDTVLNRHILLFEMLENKLDDKEETLIKLISSAGGFQVAFIQNMSLRFFISNKAELIEFQLISQLLDIELKSEILSDKIKLLSGFTYDNVNSGTYEVKLKFSYFLVDVIESEQALSESYASFLEENKSFLKRNK